MMETPNVGPQICTKIWFESSIELVPEIPLLDPFILEICQKMEDSSTLASFFCKTIEATEKILYTM